MMRPVAAVVVALAMAMAPALAQAPAATPLVRTTIAPSEGIVIGQPVQLHVEVLFPSEMPRPPLVKLAEAPGAQTLRFETQAITIRDRIGDQDYVGQRFEFVIFPRRGGDIQVPAADVTLLDRAGDPVGSAKGQQIHFSVTVPPGIDPSGPVLAASDVRVSETWSPDPVSSSFRAGSAITRAIQRKATGVPALGMVDFRFTAPEGVRVYVDPPVVDDKVDRGSVEGSRTDKATYVFEKPGSYVLPGLSQPWWDTDGRQARTETVAGVTLKVAATAAAPAQQPPWRNAIANWRKFVIPVLGAALVLLACAMLWPWLSSRWRRREQRHLASETFARKTLRRIASTGDAPASYRALATWLERLPPDGKDAARRDSRLQSLITQLEHALFGTGGSWSKQNGAELAELVAHFPTLKKGGLVHVSPPLPPLNPPPPSRRPASQESA
ncbi:hypothetical protein AB4Z40_20010 [Bosea sp. 2YAB26]|uniref:BatD family protein n=1 Tax=Bosea sp. 2YAB26 TaxID=3237478 RepID=UPI003F929062